MRNWLSVPEVHFYHDTVWIAHEQLLQADFGDTIFTVGDVMRLQAAYQLRRITTIKSDMIEGRAPRRKFTPPVLGQPSLTSDQVNDCVPATVKPVTWKAEIGSTTLRQSQHVTVKGTRRFKILTQDRDVIETSQRHVTARMAFY